MATWIQVGEEKLFLAPVKVIFHQGRRIAIFRIPQGIYAIDDCCSHAEASLAEGDVFDHQVECPSHGARFDLCTGKNLSFPAVTPVRSYPVKVENGIIYLEV